MTTQAKRGRGRPKTRPPNDVHERVYSAALVRPSLKDIRAAFNVSQHTFERWMAEDPRIQEQIDRAHADTTAAIMKKTIEKAKAGDDKSTRQYLQTFRPDLVQPDTLINIDARQLNVLPNAQPLDAFLEQKGAPALEAEPETPDKSISTLAKHLLGR